MTEDTQTTGARPFLDEQDFRMAAYYLAGALVLSAPKEGVPDDLAEGLLNTASKILICLAHSSNITLKEDKPVEAAMDFLSAAGDIAEKVMPTRTILSEREDH